MAKKQKAQGIVEFALVLPLFLLFFSGIVYFGFAFSDYIKMSNTVRAIAHEASLQTTVVSPDASFDDAYKRAVSHNTQNVVLVSDIFIWEVNPNNITSGALTVAFDKPNVVVTARAEYNPNSFFCRLVRTISEKPIVIQYRMYTTRDN